MDDLDGAGDGARVLIISLESFTESFIKIQHQKPHQDSTYPPSLFLVSGLYILHLSSYNLPNFLTKLPTEPEVNLSRRRLRLLHYEFFNVIEILTF